MIAKLVNIGWPSQPSNHRDHSLLLLTMVDQIKPIKSILT